MTFKHPISVSPEPMLFRGRPQYVVGIEVDGMFIFEPYESSCGRFRVDPCEEYGLSTAETEALVALNDKIDEATQDAINAGCLTIQKHLGVDSGDTAGTFFADSEQVNQIGKSLAHYLSLEMLRKHDIAEDDPEIAGQARAPRPA